MQLSQFKPRPKLVTQVSEITQPRFPVIDAHNHLGIMGLDWYTRPVTELQQAMQQAGVIHYVDLDGGWGEAMLNHRLNTFKAALPDQYTIFGGVDWAEWLQHGNRFGEWAAQQFRRQVARGASGLKIWKPFGLHVRDQHDHLVALDDERLSPLWHAAGELNVPVMIHIADPPAFFDPITPTNERYEELSRHPDWHFPNPPYPTFPTLINGLANLVSQHPQTDFIGAHVGCYAENLAWVSDLLDRCPNFYVDISARLGELGRQPYSARRFFLRYPGRILFGIDAGPNLAIYRRYYRWLETADEHFDYGIGETPSQGRWRIYGIHLPDEVLRQVYAENAKRLITHRPSSNI